MKRCFRNTSQLIN